MPMEYSFGTNLILLIQRLQNPDFSVLMARWEAIMQEDNMRGVMAGTDGEGNPMAKVTYRNGIAVPLKRRNRNMNGIGLPMTGSGDNLSNAEYRKLTGPPLAPRGKDSRVIRNYVTKSGFDGTNWYAEGAWLNVVSRQGIPFLRYHFEGAGRLPRRDLRGLRPWGQKQIQDETKKTLKQMLSGQL